MTWLRLLDLGLGKSFLSLAFVATYLPHGLGRTGSLELGRQFVRIGSPEKNGGGKLGGGVGG